MYIEKVFLRAEDGTIRASLTIREEQGSVRITLPKDVLFISAIDRSGRMFTAKTSGDDIFLSDMPDAILAENGGPLYAFRGDGDFAFRKWDLLSHISETPVGSQRETETISTEISEKTEKTTLPTEDPPAGAVSAAATPSQEPPSALEEAVSPEEDRQRKLREIFERGEPFPGFEKLIEGSRWVRMPEEDYLIGIVGDLVLYGVPGRLGEAPDDTCDWTFLPASEDNEDWGYYICKSSDIV